MQIKDFMERNGIESTGLAIQLLKDGIREISKEIPMEISVSDIDIVADKVRYPLPSDMMKMETVQILATDPVTGETDYYTATQTIHPLEIGDADNV